jgi:hypothetical protein
VKRKEKKLRKEWPINSGEPLNIGRNIESFGDIIRNLKNCLDFRIL